MQRFSQVFEVERSKIIVDPNRFQGRVSDYSQDTVNAIVAKGKYDKSGEPIIVWHDNAFDKYIVISGHSRFEATRQLYEAGQKDLKTIPVKEFLGDQDEAIDYAVLESNRASTEEGLISDLQAYRRAVSQGRNKQFLLGIFKPESKLKKLQQLYFLNPKGRFVEYLASDTALSFPYLERNAQWVGQLRSQLPALTDAHETEIFDYFYREGNKGLKLEKSKFFDLIDKRVNRLDFEPNNALNLHNVVSANVYTDPINEQIKEIDNQIEKWNKEISEKRHLIVRAKDEGKDDFIPKFQNRINEINQAILLKIQEQQNLRQAAGRIERQTTTDLFSTFDEPAPSPILEPIQEDVKAPEVIELRTGEKAPEPEPIKPENYWKINSDRKAELFFNYSDYKNFDDDIKKEIKQFFLWSRARGAWISKGRYDNWSVDRITKKLNLPLIGKDERKSFAEKMEEKTERAENRADRYLQKSDKALSRMNSLQSDFNKLRKDWSWLTQPNINTSGGRRFAKQRDKVISRYEQGFEEYRKSEYYQDRAATAQNTADQKKLKNPNFLQRRIKDAKADIKKLESWLPKYLDNPDYIDQQDWPEEKKQAKKDHIERAVELLQEAYEKLAFYSSKLDELHQTGQFKVWDEENIKGALYIKTEGNDWFKVIRVNKTTVTHSWFVGEFKTPYTDIQDAVFPEDDFKIKEYPGGTFKQYKYEIEIIKRNDKKSQAKERLELFKKNIAEFIKNEYHKWYWSVVDETVYGGDSYLVTQLMRQDPYIKKGELDRIDYNLLIEDLKEAGYDPKDAFVNWFKDNFKEPEPQPQPENLEDIKQRIEALKLSYEVLEDETIKNRIEALEISLDLL
jgi:hypothetical protein